MFDSEMNDLKKLVEVTRQLTPGTREYQHTVYSYNELLHRILDGGLNELLPDELLLDPWLLSERYADFEEEWGKAQPLTFGRFISDACAESHLVQILNTASSRAYARVLRTYIGGECSQIDFNYYTPWGFRRWFANGEFAFIFLDVGRTSLGKLGRMPVLGLQEVETHVTVSFAENRAFWPLEDEEIVAGEYEGARVFQFPSVRMEELIKRYARTADGRINWHAR